MTPYARLLVPAKATDEEIKHSYYAASRRLRPDLEGSDRTEWQIILNAYNLIKTDELRDYWNSGGIEGRKTRAKRCSKCFGFGVTGRGIKLAPTKICDSCKGEG